MTPEQLADQLAQLFDGAALQVDPNVWQVQKSDYRLLVLLSDEQSWLRLLMTIAPAAEALPFMTQLMEANFDQTLETRYAISQDLLWGVWQHSMAGLTVEDFINAVQQLQVLNQQGLDQSFNQLVEQQIRLIIYASKQQGQSMAATMQTLERFYEEGVMGEMADSPAARQEVLGAWRRQLERLWDEELDN
jgi:hypothetical protein